ncbi:MAG TPA: hypothetical protein VF841_16740 [Anaeromyxobacter sp.]
MTRHEILRDLDAAGAALGAGFAWLGDQALEDGWAAWVRAGRPPAALVDAELDADGRVRVTVEEIL